MLVVSFVISLSEHDIILGQGSQPLTECEADVILTIIKTTPFYDLLESIMKSGGRKFKISKENNKNTDGDRKQAAVENCLYYGL